MEQSLDEVVGNESVQPVHQQYSSGATTAKPAEQNIRAEDGLYASASLIVIQVD
jgi:hypothetical protein